MWARTGGEGVALPLDGVKVLDFSRFLSGPYCTSVLADMGADVTIENFRPGVTRRLGVDYEAVKELNDRIIYCSITGFGQTGPYAMRAGFDIIAQGVSGFMRINGHPGDEKPAKVGIAINDIAAGATGLSSLLP